MNEEAKKQLMEFATKLLQGLEKGGDFVAEQAPLVVQEIVAYGRASSTVAAVLLVAATVAWVWFVWRRVYPWFDDGGPYSGREFGFSAACIPIVALPLATAFAIHSAILAWFAPRLYVIAYLREFIK